MFAVGEEILLAFCRLGDLLCSGCSVTDDDLSDPDFELPWTAESE